MSLNINAKSCRVGKFKNLPNAFLVVKENILSGRKRYRVCDSYSFNNTQCFEDYIKDLKCNNRWVKPLVEHIHSQLTITEPLIRGLQEVSKLLNSINCDSLTGSNTSSEIADLSYYWSRVKYHVSKISCNSDCELKLRLITAGHRNARFAEFIMNLVALPDLNQIARDLNNQKSEKFDENFVNFLSKWIESFEHADCILNSILKVLQAPAIILIDQIDATLSSVKNSEVDLGYSDTSEDTDWAKSGYGEIYPGSRHLSSQFKHNEMIPNRIRSEVSSHFQTH